MKKVKLNAAAPILIPNPDHRNFTDSGNKLPSGHECKGEFIVVEGLRKGKPFQYNLFKTNKNQIIFKKFVDPMDATEITLGADAAVSPTKVEIPSTEKADRSPLVGALVGAGLGFAVAKYKKVAGVKKTAIYVIVGAVVGYATGKVIANRKKITVVKSK